MKASQMIESKYLKQADIEGELIVTIQAMKQANIAPEDKPEELKWLLKFKELPKPLVLNSTNIHTLEKLCGDETDLWPGQEVVVYVDPNVSYAGELVGGIRLRSAAPVAAPKRAVPKGHISNMPDDIPF